MKTKYVILLSCFVLWFIGLFMGFTVQYAYYENLYMIEWNKILLGGSGLGILFISLMLIYVWSGQSFTNGSEKE